ncbi:MAG: branched-chain amino acid ABC transporter permease [Candidatus Desulforudis sp.]|nr:branched-chain amino acid ABC transporter permease [Desulforudis sp.]
MSLESQLLQYLISGLTLGSIYAVIAIGLVVTFNITGIFNLALGEFVTIGALAAISLYAAGLPLIVAFVLAVIVAAVLGALMERTAIHPARNANATILTLVIITIGVGIAMRGASLLIWGTHPYTLPPFSAHAPFTVGGATVIPQSFWVLGLGVVCVAVLFAFFEFTYLGKAVRACVMNRTAARLVGVNPNRLSLAAFTVTGALGALAGIFITPITFATFDMGFMLGLKGFVAAILGGVTNVPGAIIGGFLLGILEAFGVGLIGSGLKDAVAMLVMIVVLLVRPSGILGSLHREM